MKRTDLIGGFFRYEKYNRRDIHRILNWSKEPNHLNIGGYKSSDDKTNCPIFVTYKKDEKIPDTIKYEDEFINNVTLQWFSKQNRTLESNDVEEIKNSNKTNMRLPSERHDVDMGKVPVPHFGVHLNSEVFNKIKKNIEQHDKVNYLDNPYTRFKGQKEEQETFFIEDPHGNVLELKTMKN